jgi:hypothetical protein
MSSLICSNTWLEIRRGLIGRIFIVTPLLLLVIIVIQCLCKQLYGVHATDRFISFTNRTFQHDHATGAIHSNGFYASCFNGLNFIGGDLF